VFAHSFPAALEGIEALTLPELDIPSSILASIEKASGGERTAEALLFVAKSYKFALAEAKAPVVPVKTTTL
jgi:hypothetical protein